MAIRTTNISIMKNIVIPIQCQFQNHHESEKAFPINEKNNADAISLLIMLRMLLSMITEDFKGFICYLYILGKIHLTDFLL